jgi:hypothetical protein
MGGFEIAKFRGLRLQNLAISFFRFPLFAKHDSLAASEETMRPKKPETTRSGDLFRARLDQIINLKHELDTQNPRRIFISGQKRGVFGVIKRELRRRSAIEPVIGHMKAEGTSAAAISKAALATPPTPSSPLSDTTSDASSHG